MIRGFITYCLVVCLVRFVNGLECWLFVICGFSVWIWCLRLFLWVKVGGWFDVFV